MKTISHFKHCHKLLDLHDAIVTQVTRISWVGGRYQRFTTYEREAIRHDPMAGRGGWPERMIAHGVYRPQALTASPDETQEQ